MKQCTKCKKEYPATTEYFYNQKYTSGYKLQSWCKECAKELSKNYQRNNKDKASEYHAKWYRQNTEKALEYSIGWNHQHKDRMKIQQREWQINNPDKCKENNIKRQHKNHKITKKEWTACKEYFDNKCAYCGLSIKDHWIEFRGKMQLGDFHKEHFDHEGSNGLENCVPSCKSCNSTKKAKKFNKWYNQKNPVFNQERLDKIIQWLNEDYKKYLEN